jgi:glyoxalase family protein
MKQTAGIHHITAIVGHPQENVDFYAGVLGLRMVKKTVNFDDPGTYHLYFGNGGGKPGTIITFFPWAKGRSGRIGDGQVGITSYLIPLGAMDFWEKRLLTYGIDTTKQARFDQTYLQFADPHGLKLELVEGDAGEANTWEYNGITPDVAIKGFAGAVLYSSQPAGTAEVIESVMGLEKIGEENGLMRFQSPGEIGNVIEVKKVAGERGSMGVGTVHHIAFRAKDDADHVAWQKHVRNNGYAVTEVRDRNYFNAIYFQEAGNILFEIATDPPGFAHDESEETMGQVLKLPSQYEAHRTQLEETLIPIEVREVGT